MKLVAVLSIAFLAWQSQGCEARRRLSDMQSGDSNYPSPALRKNFTLPPLTYAYNALEPSIDTQTMTFHHDVHHLAYVNNLNALLASPNLGHLANKTLSELVKLVGSKQLDAATTLGIRNQGGGAWNHAMFWRIMAPYNSSNTTLPDNSTAFYQAVTKTFGSIEAMISRVSSAAKGHFGSGWGWLVYNPRNSTLVVIETSNQDSPLSKIDKTPTMIPILGIDVWEHSYYLKYGPRRASFVDNWWQVTNWQQVSLNYKAALKGDLEAIIGANANRRQ